MEGEGERMEQSDWSLVNGSVKEYVVIHAKENGVHVIGLTRGESTKFHHTEKLDKNEVMIAQFTEHTSAMKIRGKAVIYTAVGVIDTTKE